MSIAEVVDALPAISVLITALIGVAGYRLGRGKTRADEQKTRAEAAKVVAETRQLEAEAQKTATEATFEQVAGGINARFDEVGGRLGSLEASLARVVHEVTPNHGGSIKDAVGRLEQDQRRDRAEQAEWRRSLGHQVGEIRQTVTSEAEDRRDGDKRAVDATSRIEEKVDHIIEEHGGRLVHLETELRKNHPC